MGFIITVSFGTQANHYTINSLSTADTCQNIGATFKTSLGRYYIVFQAEMRAISACVHRGLEEDHKGKGHSNTVRQTRGNHRPQFRRNFIRTGMEFPPLTLCIVNCQDVVFMMSTWALRD